MKVQNSDRTYNEHSSQSVDGRQQFLEQLTSSDDGWWDVKGGKEEKKVYIFYFPSFLCCFAVRALLISEKWRK